MSGASYNGYSWEQRAKKLRHRGSLSDRDQEWHNLPCALCGDPDRDPKERHSEDYSEPFLFSPPHTYPLCKSCHLRLHKRFKRPAEEWELFCLHVEAGGYGREFVSTYPAANRKVLCNRIRQGELIRPEPVRPIKGRSPWWRQLTLDPESLDAPWARPRPLRERPPMKAYSEALQAIRPTEREWDILRFHARAHRRTTTMRSIAEEVFGSHRHTAANSAYGRFAKRLCEELGWEPDTRNDGSKRWLGIVAEGWTPRPNGAERREFELVMIRNLAEAIDKS